MLRLQRLQKPSAGVCLLYWGSGPHCTDFDDQ
jgi:hypothetical protein